jgi:ribosomal protein L16 Arg81 hydroxylase
MQQAMVTDAQMQWLLAPFLPADFFNSHWERKFLHIANRPDDYFLPLFSITHLEELLTASAVSPGFIRVVRNQQILPTEKLIAADGSLAMPRFYAAYSDGYTINVNEAHRFWPPLQVITAQLQAYLNHRVVCNLYASPSHQQALAPHYDAHDVFVLQIQGYKRWTLYERVVECPLVDSFQPVFDRSDLSNGHSIDLSPGDLLYIPRGTPHEAIPYDGHSLHLTIGVYPFQWIDLLSASLRARAEEDSELRRALPIAFFNLPGTDVGLAEDLRKYFDKLINDFSSQASPAQGMARLREQFRGYTQALPDGHFSQLSELERLDLDFWVECRPLMVRWNMNTPDAARLIYSGNILKAAPKLRVALEFIGSASGAFQIKNIPGLSDDNRLDLAARLIRGGLLRCCSRD